MDEKLEISAAIREAWDKRFLREVRAVAKRYDEEVELIDALIARVEAGNIWTESGGDAMIGSMRWTDDAVQAAIGDAPEEMEANNRRLLTFAGVAVIFFVIIVIWQLGPRLFSGSKTGATITGTPPASGSSLIAGLSGFGSSGSNPVQIVDGMPRSLEINGIAYQVTAGKVNDSGKLDYPNQIDKLAVWFAAPVNWLMGLDQKTIATLKVGDQISARTATGNVVSFVVDSVTKVEPQEIERLSQKRAGLTLFALPASASPVTVITAQYNATNEVSSIATIGNGHVQQVVDVLNGQAIVAKVTVQKQDTGLYLISIIGEVSVAVRSVTLDVNGQLYPATQPLGAGIFDLRFQIPEVGNATLIIEGIRIDLGALAEPSVTAEIVAVIVQDNTLRVTFTARAANGTTIVSERNVELTDANNTRLAALNLAPTNVLLDVNGQTFTAQFALVPGGNNTTYKFKFFNQLWSIK